MTEKRFIALLLFYFLMYRKSMTQIHAIIRSTLVTKKRNDYTKSILYLPQVLEHGKNTKKFVVPELMMN